MKSAFHSKRLRLYRGAGIKAYFTVHKTLFQVFLLYPDSSLITSYMFPQKSCHIKGPEVYQSYYSLSCLSALALAIGLFSFCLVNSWQKKSTNFISILELLDIF
jgi:hypothetical protein